MTNKFEENSDTKAEPAEQSMQNVWLNEAAEVSTEAISALKKYRSARSGHGNKVEGIMTESLDIIRRLEILGGPCRETDVHIVNAIRQQPIDRDGFINCRRVVEGEALVLYWENEDGRRGSQTSFPSEPYTASVDEAMTLFPHGWEWQIDNCMASNSDGVVYTVKLGEIITVEHKSLPIAICIAALEAHKNLNESAP